MGYLCIFTKRYPILVYSLPFCIGREKNAPNRIADRSVLSTILYKRIANGSEKIVDLFKVERIYTAAGTKTKSQTIPLKQYICQSWAHRSLK